MNVAEFPMDKNEVIATLRAHEPELKAAGIAHLALHGSVVRGEAGPESDVDLLYEFDRAVSLIGFEGIRNLISDILGGVPVDLADRHRLRDHVKPNAEREAELVF